jgi:ribulose-5-phosphate 4-epimerase/fuculose-1-phosphate aldolase
MPLYMENEAIRAEALPMTQAEQEARVQLAACYRIFDFLGWTEMIFNHITLRVPGTERIFLINPFGLHYREVTASNLVAIDVRGNRVRPTPYTVNRAGFVIHSAIHEAIDAAHCVMHTHTTTGMAVSCLKDGLSPNTFNGAQLYGRVAYHEFEGVTVEAGEQERLVRSLGDKQALILRNHGLLAWGPSVQEAFMLLWTMQRACDVQIAAAAAGQMNPVSESAIEQSVRESGPGEKQICDMVFDALVRRIEALDPDYKN